ncbi:MAG: DUF3298 domain-containing protein, partial [Candidatus Cryptobacteroides sp.]
MKNISLKAGVACLAVLSAISCQDNNALKTGHFEMYETKALAEGRTDSISVSTTIEYPESGLPEDACSKITEGIVKLSFGVEGGSIEEAARNWADSCVAEYRESGNDLLKYLEGNDDGEPCAALSWECSVDGHIAGVHGDILSYIVCRYDYTGGAHGSTSETGINFNRNTGEVIGEDDIFEEGSTDELKSLLSAHLQESLPDNDAYDALFIKDIEPNGNFIVTPAGVTYIYGQYEIG